MDKSAANWKLELKRTQTITAATHDFWLIQKRTVSSEGKSVKNLARMFSLNHIRGATHHTILWHCFFWSFKRNYLYHFGAIFCLKQENPSSLLQNQEPHNPRPLLLHSRFIPALFRIILSWYCRIWSKTELRLLKTTQSKTCLIHIDDVLVIIWNNLKSKTTWTLPDNHTNDKTEIQLTNYACRPHGVIFFYLPGEKKKKSCPQS